MYSKKIPSSLLTAFVPDQFFPSGTFGSSIATLTFTIFLTDLESFNPTTYVWAWRSIGTSTASAVITVNPRPIVSFNSGFSNVCKNGSPFTLDKGSPAGGVYSGTGVSAGKFDPTANGVIVGSNYITYTYTANTGCISYASSSISVIPIPTITALTIPSVCLNGASASLAAYFNASPSGGSGTYSGTGVSSSGTFTPSSAGTGSKAITFTYTVSNGCLNSATGTIIVLNLPNVIFNKIFTTCKNSTPFPLSGGLPDKGVYSASSGVSNNQFDPSVTGAGLQTLTYTYTDVNGCPNSAQSIVNVLSLNKPDLPVLSNFNSVMCKSSAQTLKVTDQGTDTVKWYGGSGKKLSTGTTYTITNILKDTSLIIQYTDTNNCLSDKKNVVVLLDKVKAAFTIGSDTVKLSTKVNLTNTSANADTCIWTMFKSGTTAIEGTPMGTEGTNIPTFYCNIAGKKDIELVAISSNNCRDTTKATIIVVSSTSIQDQKQSPDHMLVYPNPMKDFVNIDLSGVDKEVSVSLFNMKGIKILEKQIKMAAGIEKIDVSGLPKGIYMLDICIEDKPILVKLEK